MKKFFLFLLIFILLIGILKAQESPKYNFASMQADKGLNIAPGETIETKLYFYNIYGNRITHIALFIGEAPENWDISFDPALHQTIVSVGGVKTTVTENLYVEPSEAVDEIPSVIPEGIDYIQTAVGYVGAKPVKIKIKVPSNEKLGKQAKVIIDATASWLGQAGAAAIQQSRDFEYTVTVSSKEFTEQILPVEEEKPEVKEEKPVAIDLSVVEKGTIKGSEGDSFVINVKEEKHTISIVSVGDDFVTITIASDPISLTLKIDSPEKVDVNNDGLDDLLITLNKIVNGEADISVEKIKEEKITGEVIAPVTTAATKETKGISSIMFYGIVFVLLIIILFLLMFVVKRKKKEEKEIK